MKNKINVVGMILDNDFEKDVRVKNEVGFLIENSISISIINRNLENSEASSQLKKISAGSFTRRQKISFISETTIGDYSTFWRKKIKNFILENAPAILHVHDLYLLKPALEASAQEVPVVIDLHENYPAAFRSYSWTKKFPHRLFVNEKYWDKIEETLLPKASGIIVLSQHYKNNLISRYPKLSKIPIAVYPNVPDLNQLGPVKDYPTDRNDGIFRILYFGMIGKTRGLHIVSQTVRKLLDEGLKVEFIAVGAVHKSDRIYFENEVLGPGVKHISWIELHELGEVLSDVDACISPIEKNEAHESGIANKVFQYMYFKKPVLVSNCVPQEELVQSTNSGIAYLHDDPIGLANAIKFLINHPDKRKEMGKNGHTAIIGKYNSQVLGSKILELYREVLSE